MEEHNVSKRKGRVQAILVMSILIIPILVWGILVLFGETRCNPLPIMKIVNEQGDSIARKIQLPAGLVDQDNKAFTAQTLHEKHHLAGFIFTTCPISCPLVIQGMKEVFDAQKGFEDVQFVAYTVDPVFDTPQVLADYAKARALPTPPWHLVTGDSAALRSLILSQYLQSVQDTPQLPEKITHSAMLVLIDADGRLRGFYNSIEDEDLKKLKDELNVLRCEYR